MSDRILIDRIAVFAHHGVLPEEAQNGQTFYLSLDCRLDLRDAGRTDDLNRTVNYAELAVLARDVATTRRFALIEALADTIARLALDRFVLLDAITVRIDKPSAPIDATFETVAVVVERHRG